MRPSSSMSMAQPVASMIARTFLPPGTDDGAHLIGLDVDGGDARRILGEFAARGGDRLGHLAEDMDAPGPRLVQGLLHDCR